MVLNLWVVTLFGVIYQISYISDIYDSYHLQNYSYEIKTNFMIGGHHNMKSHCLLREASNFSMSVLKFSFLKQRCHLFPENGHWVIMELLSVGSWGCLPNAGPWFFSSLRHKAQGGFAALVCVGVHHLHPSHYCWFDWCGAELSSRCFCLWNTMKKGLRDRYGWSLSISRDRLGFYASSGHLCTHPFFHLSVLLKLNTI